MSETPRRTVTELFNDFEGMSKPGPTLEPITDFDAMVADKINAIPGQESIDPYKKQAAGTVIEMPFDYKYGRDGKIEFGRKLDVRRLMVSGAELVYAFNREQGKSEFHVNTFHEVGGLVLRTVFRDSSSEAGEITVQFGAPPFEGYVHQMYGHGFYRSFTKKEREILERVIPEPDDNIEDLIAAIPTKRDQKKIQKAIRDDAAREAQHRKELEQIASSGSIIFPHRVH